MKAYPTGGHYHGGFNPYQQLGCGFSLHFEREESNSPLSSIMIVYDYTSLPFETGYEIQEFANILGAFSLTGEIPDGCSAIPTWEKEHIKYTVNNGKDKPLLEISYLNSYYIDPNDKYIVDDGTLGYSESWGGISPLSREECYMVSKNLEYILRTTQYQNL